MRRKTKEEAQAREARAALTLSSETREPLMVFPEMVVRPLRRMITLLAANESLPQRIALVSALRGEGVTYTSLALATILAHDMARNVALVEMNWEAPGLARLLASQDPGSGGAPDAQTRVSKDSRGVVGPAPGTSPVSASTSQRSLAAVLTDQATLDEALVWMGLPNLALLPGGQLPIEGREALVWGPRLKQIIEQMTKFFDYLVLDIPAIVATSDAIPLARLGEAALLVVRQGVTPRRVVAAAIDDLSTCNVLGTVLNRAKVATPRWALKLIPQG